ncbi:MAG: hypothetical protein PHP37_04330 [Patescibacteria group bacterium]|nr:hypothetical protein [Patescibacteria group bacterium]
MTKNKKLPKSLRRFIRMEKSEIRRDFHLPEDIEEKIRLLYEKVGKKNYDYKRDI